MMAKKFLRILFAYSACLILAACATSSATQTVASVTDTPVLTVTAVAPTETLTPTPAVPTGPQAGTQMLYADGSTLIYIPAGEFQMGGGGKDNPMHMVKLDAYWIQRTEVTRRMYSICLAAGICTQTKDLGVGGIVSDSAYLDYPVVGIDWTQAQSYCAWISGSLPTEAEWEMAARGPQGNIYPWGNAEPSCDLLNFNSCIGAVNRATNNQSDKSSFGVLDMGGNVREWVSDFYQADYYKNSPSKNPRGPAKGDYKVIRGSGFISLPKDVTTYSRSILKAGSARNDLGFRCVVGAPQSYAPYCQVAPIQKTSDSQTPPLPERCVPDIERLSGYNCPNLNAVSGGQLVSVEGLRAYNCVPEENNKFGCTMPIVPGLERGTITELVKVCISCGGVPAPEASSLSCPLNYKEKKGSSYCQYEGGSVHGCPAGSVPLNDNQCVYYEQPADGCPLGSYFDKGLQACVTISQTDSDCLSGITYLDTEGCCRAPLTNDNNPQCRSDEYYSFKYGCIPLPQTNHPVESCVTAQLQLPICH